MDPSSVPVIYPIRPPRVYPRSLIAIALLLFSPLGFYLMYKDPHYHFRFPALLYLTATTPLMLYMFISYLSLYLPLTRQFTTSGFLLLVVVSLIQLPAGYILKNRINSQTVYREFLMASVALLLLNYLFSSLAVSSVVDSAISQFTPI
jgi:hypothetical protein